MKQITTILCCLLPLLLIGQEGALVRGKIFYNNNPLQGVHIHNIDNQHFTTTDAQGSFVIEANVGNSLKCTYVGKKTIYHSLTKLDFTKLILFKMTDLTIQLDEVEVKKAPKITAQNLGIQQHTPQKRTYQEKRVISETKIIDTQNLLFKLLMGNIAINFNALINAISGKSKIIKKEAANEKNLLAAAYIVQNMTTYLKIEHQLTEEEIAILAFYVMEKPELHDLIEKKDNKQLEISLYEWWNEYKQLQLEN